jgi:hypothetical protein
VTPAQQQILAQVQQHMQSTTARLQQLFAEASGGCRQLVDRNPVDLAPLGNALGAIGEQVKTQQRALWDGWDALRERIDQAQDSRDPGRDDAHHEGDRQYRWADLWMTEQWMRFESHWRMEQLRAMWPHVQAAAQRPAPCTRCGQPLQLATRAQAQTVACPSCRAQNQVAPDMACAQYVGMAESVAQAQSMDRQLAVLRYNVEWEDRRHAAKRQTGDWPDEPIESLKHREQLELAWYQAHIQAKSAMDPLTPEQQKQFVDGRMKHFYERMGRNEVWRRAYGMQSLDVRAPEGARDWGPLRPDAVDDFYFHGALIQYTQEDPGAQAKAFAKLGYRDLMHWKIVEKTFLEYWGERVGDPQFQQAASRAAMRAMNERASLMADQNQGLIEPIEGVSIETYAGLMAKVGSASDDEFVRLLAQNQMDRAKWDRVNKAWMARMSTDSTGTIATAYSKAFLGAGQGQYGAAGAAAAAAMGAGGVATAGPGGAEPVSFEKYAEISGAMSAWSKQGKDISAGLHKHFAMTAQDFSSISMFWSTKMTQDFSLMDRLSDLTTKYEQQYLGMA